MITIPGKDGRLLFSVCRSLIAWRGRGRAWVMIKPPWNRPLFSERNGLKDVVWSFRGWRLIVDRRVPEDGGA